MVRKREAYQSNPEIRDKKKEAGKKSYKIIKKRKDLLKKEKEKEWKLKWAQETHMHQLRFSQERNLMCKKRFNWVKKCLSHFFENFDKIDENVKAELITLEKSIEETYEIWEKKIEDFDLTVKAEGYKHKSMNQDNIQWEWRKLEGKIDKRLRNILSQTKDMEENKKWYIVLDKVHETYIQKYTGENWFYWKKGDYLPKKFPYLPCIICNQESNCLEQPEEVLCTFTWTVEKERKFKKKQREKKKRENVK